MKDWSKLVELQRNLDKNKVKNNSSSTKNKKVTSSNLKQFVSRTDSALKKIVNLNQLKSSEFYKLSNSIRTDNALIMRRFVHGMKITFFSILFMILFAPFFGEKHGGVLTLSWIAWSLFLFIKTYKPFWIASFNKTVTYRLMRYEGFNSNSQYPLTFTYLTTNSSSCGIGVDWSSYKEDAMRTPQEGGYVIAFVNRENRNHGIITIDQTGSYLRTYNDGDGTVSIKNTVIDKAKFDQFIEEENDARAVLAEQSQSENAKKREVGLSVESLREAWRQVVIQDDILEDLLRSELLFAYSDPAAPKGILLKGSPGTGKSLSAQTFAESSGAEFFKLSIADVKGEYVGHSAGNVKRLWQEARDNAPSVIFIDECDGVFAKRGSDQGDQFSDEVVQAFLTEWDGIGGKSNVLVIGATNRPELLDDAVISRFTDVFELRPADAAGIVPLVDAVLLQLGVKLTVPADIIDSLKGMSGREVKNTIQQAMRLAAPNQPTSEHFKEAIGKIRGKGSTKVADGASWDTLILPAPLKTKIKSMTQMLREASELTAKGVPVPRTLLLYGPPGTGKTQIARTIANVSGLNFIARTTADLKGQYIGHTATRIAQTFETARSSSPSILFIDEIDALASTRGGQQTDSFQAEAVTQLLQELDGIADKAGFVLVVAATNLMDQLDSAILSRFSQKLEIQLPTTQERTEILHTLLKGRPVAKDVDPHHVSSICDGFSGRDLRELVTQAFNLAFQRIMDEGKTAAEIELNMNDLRTALEQA